MLAVPAIMMPMMYGAIIDDTGWTRGQVTAFSSWKFLAGAITSLLFGFVVDRIGLRRVVFVGTLLTGLPLMAVYFVTELWVFYLFGFVLGVTAIIAAVGVKILIGNWFMMTLGRAVGIAFVGGSLAGVVTPITTRLLIDAYGWQSATAIVGAAILLLVLPVFLLLVREKPEDYGASAEQLDGPPEARGSVGKRGPELRELFRLRTFWLILMAHFFVGAIDHSMLEHTALFLERDAGLGHLAAAGGLTVAFLASSVGKVGFGWLFDRLSNRGIALCWWSLAIGILLAFPVSSVWTMTLFAVFRGASHGGILIDVACLARHNFGTRSLSTTVSFFTGANMLGGAASTAAVGYAHDILGSYTVPFVVLMLLALVAGLLVAFIKPAYWRPVYV
jgi:sugar phosphate permease